MTKAKFPKKGEPLTDTFHPKDTASGVIARVMGHGSNADYRRGTILISTGGVTCEFTPAATRLFIQEIQCALDCLERTTVGKDGGR